MTFKSRELVLSRIQIALVFLSFAGLQVLLTMHLRMAAIPQTEPPAEKIQEYNPKLFELMSFGQLPAVIDWVWIKTLQDPILTHVTKGTHPAIFYTLDLVTDLDPAFMKAYSVGATLVSVVRDDGPGALHLAEKGEKFREQELPKYNEEFRKRYWYPEWEIPVLLGYIYMFDLEDIPKASIAFKKAAEIPDAPVYVKPLVQDLAAPDGLYVVGARLLKHLSDSTKDPAVREKLLTKKTWLEVSRYMHGINVRFQDFVSKHSRKADFSWAKYGPQLWSEFRSKSDVGFVDPWGGEMTVNETGKIVTTTPHEKVLGLE